MSRHRLKLWFDPANEDPCRLTAVVDLGAAGQHTVYFASDGVRLRRSGEVLFCMGLAPAMQLGWDLVIDAPIDRTLLENSSAVQEFFTTWYPDFSRIDIEASPSSGSDTPLPSRGLFFSGGVDSFYSAVIERQSLDYLVTILGADVNVDNKVGTEHLRRLAQAVGEAWGKTVIEIRTDVRTVFNGLIGWEEFHGSVLAAVRHMLADQIGIQLIASTAGESSWQRGWGSHPALDPLYGTASSPILHHGLVGRADKIRTLIDEPVAMNHLKVCFERHDGTNCGVCDKCTYTVEALALFRALDRAPTMPDAVGRTTIRCTGKGNYGDLINLLSHIRRLGGRPDLELAVTQAIADFDRVAWRRRLGSIRRLVKRQRRKFRLEQMAWLKSHALPS